MGIQIVSTGSYLPKTRVSNDDLTKFLDTSDEWIYPRTGIKTRHIAAGETLTGMGIEAARQALTRSGLAPGEIGLVICVTMMPDAFVPMAAATIKMALGIDQAAAFDMNANCSGFAYGVTVAYSLMKTAGYRHAIVIGADVNSQILDWTDRATCVLFGDGAGAVVLSDTARRGILTTYLNCKADTEGALLCRTPVDPTPFCSESVQGADTKVKMNGAAVMRFAVRAFPEIVEQVIRQAGITVDDIKLFIPHQANLRILLSAGKSMGIPMERFYLNIEETANTSSGTLPIALDWAVRDGRIHSGDLVLLIAFGGGLSSGAVLFEW